MTQYIPLLRSCKSLQTLTQAHVHLVVTGLHKHPQASTKLIDSYSLFKSLHSSLSIFTSFPNPDPFMWALLLKHLLWHNLHSQCLSFYAHMRRRVPLTRFVFPSVIRACGTCGDTRVGTEAHGRAVKSGFGGDCVVQTALVGFYGEAGRLGEAMRVFEEMSVRDDVAWSEVISCCVENGEENEGLEMFRDMVEGGVRPDKVTMLSVVEGCGRIRWLKGGKAVHGYVVRMGFGQEDESLDGSLIVMYAKCGDLKSPGRIFSGNVGCRGTACWTAMISCYNQGGCFVDALEIFVGMRESGVEVNYVTLLCVLPSCVGLGLLREGKSVHGFVIRKCVDPELEHLGSQLLEFYAELGEVSYCQNVLDMIGGRNVVPWNTIISVYCQKGQLREALLLLVRMQGQGLMPDSFSMSSILAACGKMGVLEVGHQIHCHIVKRGYRDEFVLNSLIDMYSKCGFVDSAYTIFETIKDPRIITWNSMISGFSRSGNSLMAISLFDKIYLNFLEIDEVTILCVIQACSELGYIEKGKWVHHKLITYGTRRDLFIDTALTDMYAKSGDLRSAQGVFDTMSERSVVSWSVMIAAYGMHGKVHAAISLFSQMLETGIEPNEVTFMNILSTCSHAGAIEEGRLYFRSMRDFGIEPNAEHFSCIVDLLSRAGDLNGAYDIIKSIPFSVDASIWGSLLNGCRIHQRMDMIKIIEKDLLDITTDDTGYYTLYSNIYAEGGNWEEFGNVRSMMKGIGLRKVPGYSMIEIDRQMYRFGAGDTPLPKMKEIYGFLEKIQCLTHALGIR